MIPKNINRSHILKAIREIDRNGFPRSRKSRKFQLVYRGRNYPPKYVVSLANKHASGFELESSQFSGGQETNSSLRRLGFKIVELLQSGTAKPTAHQRKRHDERCPECKRTIEVLLRQIYGEVKVNYRFETGTKPQDYKQTAHYHNLKEIFNELQNHRGHKDFVKARALPHCDFFIPDPGFIVEFDESQHFTACRKLALSKYPETLELGFDRDKWIKLCEIVDAKDNDPIYRDEQRAWYDTLRDFLPSIQGLKPTIRLFSQDLRWCGLRPENPSDGERFKEILKGTKRNWIIEVRQDPDPSLGRIIVAGDWQGNIDATKSLLKDICDAWPKKKRVSFLITCGGFINFPWPSSLSNLEVGNPVYPERAAVEFLAEEARRNVELLLTENLCDKLEKCTRYLTVGIDTSKSKISVTRNYISEPHIELVFLIDLKERTYRWTGKSYPTPNQERGLVRTADLEKHFFESDFGKVLILGCHDLTIFNPRSDATAKGWRKEVKDEFKLLSKKRDPSIVLQHPHTTDSSRIWLTAWNSLARLLPNVKEYASAGRYYNKGEPCRSELLDVLRKTKCADTLDFIVRV
jgi:hypothetical protein